MYDQYKCRQVPSTCCDSTYVLTHKLIKVLVMREYNS